MTLEKLEHDQIPNFFGLAKLVADRTGYTNAYCCQILTGKRGKRNTKAKQEILAVAAQLTKSMSEQPENAA